MTILYHIVLGFIFSFIGTVPLGIINLAVAELSIRKGIRAAMLLATGAVIIEFFQTLITLHITNIFNSNPDFKHYFNMAAVPIFFGLAIYFFVLGKQAKKSETEEKLVLDKEGLKSPFFKGMLISTLNVMIIPFWIIWGTYLNLHGWLILETDYILLFSTATSLGTICIFWIYAKLGQLLVVKMKKIAQWNEFIIAGVFVVLGIYQLIQILVDS